MSAIVTTQPITYRILCAVELEVNVHVEHVRDLRLRMRLGRTLFVFSFCNMGSLVLAILATPLVTGEAFLGVLPHARGAAFWAEYAALSYSLVPTALSMVLLQCCHAEAGTKLVAMYRMLHNDILTAGSRQQVQRAACLHARVLVCSQVRSRKHCPATVDISRIYANFCTELKMELTRGSIYRQRGGRAFAIP